MNRRSGKRAASSILQWIAAGLFFALPMSLPAQQRPNQVLQLLERAFTHHELASLYIKRGEAENAVAEARKMLQLRIPAEQEHLVVKSLAIIADKLGELRRFDLAQSLLDEALKSTEVSVNQAKVLKTKARLYRLAGDDDRAIDAYKRALELEGKIIR